VLPITKVLSKTVPIEPQVGPPPAGFHVVSIRPNPSSVTITGDRDRLDSITRIPSEKIDLGNLHDSKTFNTTLVFPEGIRPLGVASVSVTVTVASGPAPAGDNTGAEGENSSASSAGESPPAPGAPEIGGAPTIASPAEPGSAPPLAPRGAGPTGRPTR